MRAAEVFFALGIIAAHAVDYAARLADDGDVSRTKSREHSPAVGVRPTVAPVVSKGFGVGEVFKILTKIKNSVVIAVFAADELYTCFEIKGGIRPEAQGGDAVGACRKNDLAASVFAKVKHRLELRGLQLGGIRFDAIV